MVIGSSTSYILNILSATTSIKIEQPKKKGIHFEFPFFYC